MATLVSDNLIISAYLLYSSEYEKVTAHACVDCRRNDVMYTGVSIPISICLVACSFMWKAGAMASMAIYDCFYPN